MAIVLVSHSRTLAEGLREMVEQVAGEVPVEVGAGTGDGRLGTSAPLIAAAIRKALAASRDTGAAEGVIVLLDLGSAALSLELALEDLEPSDRAGVRVSSAPLVEGAILAAVQASVGATLDEVVAAAAGASSMPKYAGA